MPGNLVQVGASVMCPHGGQVQTPGNARVTAGGAPVCTVNDVGTVAGCAFTLPNGKPQPCAKTQWLVGAARVTVGGVPALVVSSSGLCQSAEGIPQGPPSIVSTQTRVTAQ